MKIAKRRAFRKRMHGKNEKSSSGEDNGSAYSEKLKENCPYFI